MTNPETKKAFALSVSNQLRLPRGIRLHSIYLPARILYKFKAMGVQFYYSPINVFCTSTGRLHYDSASVVMDSAFTSFWYLMYGCLTRSFCYCGNRCRTFKSLLIIFTKLKFRLSCHKRDALRVKCSGASRGGTQGAGLPLFWVKKKESRQGKQNKHPSSTPPHPIRIRHWLVVCLCQRF